jgi:hypothetical protein
MTKAAGAKSPKNPPSVPNPGTAIPQGNAARMVTAQANVEKLIDTRKMQAGQKIEIVLSDKVQLKNGPKLPRGTLLTGTASPGDAQSAGTGKLTLRFTRAQLKGGKTIPIKATIVGLFPANSAERSDHNIWSGKSLKTDQSETVPGLALHSNIKDSDSGVLVSTKGDVVKVMPGNWMALVIEALPDSEQESNGPNGGA